MMIQTSGINCLGMTGAQFTRWQHIQRITSPLRPSLLFPFAGVEGTFDFLRSLLMALIAPLVVSQPSRVRIWLFGAFFTKLSSVARSC